MNWIKNYWQLEEKIAVIEWDIKRSQLEFKRWEPGGDLFDNSAFETSLDNQQRVAHSIQSLNNVLEEKKKLKGDLTVLIDSFKGLDNQILKMKYIHGMTLESIAFELNYSHNYIKRKHAEVMRIIKFAESMKGVIKP